MKINLFIKFDITDITEYIQIILNVSDYYTLRLQLFDEILFAIFIWI